MADERCLRRIAREVTQKLLTGIHPSGTSRSPEGAWFCRRGIGERLRTPKVFASFERRRPRGLMTMPAFRLVLIAIRESRIAFPAFGHEFSNASQNRSPQTAFIRFFDEEL